MAEFDILNYLRKLDTQLKRVLESINKNIAQRVVPLNRIEVEYCNRIIVAANSIAEEVQQYIALPYESTNKALVLALYHSEFLNHRADIKKELTKLKVNVQYLLKVVRILHTEFRGSVTSSFNEKKLMEVVNALKQFISRMKEFDHTQIEKFYPYVYQRVHLRLGNIKADFIFFDPIYETVYKLFRDRYFAVFLYYNRKDQTFHELYTRISNLFFNEVIMYTLRKEAYFFESFYGRNYKLNFTIYFTTKVGSQVLMFVTNIIKLIKNPRTKETVINPKTGEPFIEIKATPERGDLRVFVPIENMDFSFKIYPDAFFHEIAHIFDTNTDLAHDLGRIRAEGLAVLAEFKSSPSSVISEQKPFYDKFLQEGRQLTTKTINLAYSQGLHMWLVIYFSKLKLQTKPNLLILTEDLAQYMQGSYEKLFYAWFSKFRHFNNGKFLEEYLKCTRILGIRSILHPD